MSEHSPKRTTALAILDGARAACPHLTQAELACALLAAAAFAFAETYWPQSPAPFPMLGAILGTAMADRHAQLALERDSCQGSA